MSSVSVELKKQKCIRCNKQLRPIKNDFDNRKYHKKCHYDNQDELKFNFIKTTDWINNNNKINKSLNPETYNYLDNLDKEFIKFMIK